MAAELKHVLFVDDDADILEIARMSLEMVGGLRVTCCRSGREALAQVVDAMPGMILLDVMMPEMDGVTALAEIRKNAALDGIPVVFMTARVQASEVRDYLQKGAVATISKPFDPMQLPKQVLDIWGRLARG